MFVYTASLLITKNPDFIINPLHTLYEMSKSNIKNKMFFVSCLWRLEESYLFIRLLNKNAIVLLL